MIWIALAILVATVLLEDIQEVNNSHGWLADRWDFARNRWYLKYKNLDGPYRWKDTKWWNRIGLGAFVDLWHVAKTLRLWLFCYLLVSFAGLSAWYVPVAWVVYGLIHDHVFYGRLRAGIPGQLIPREESVANAPAGGVSRGAGLSPGPPSSR